MEPTRSSFRDIMSPQRAAHSQRWLEEERTEKTKTERDEGNRAGRGEL